MKLVFNQITLENLLFKAEKTRLTDEELVVLREQKTALEKELLLVSHIALDCAIRIEMAMMRGEEEDLDFADFLREIRKTYTDLKGVFARLEQYAFETLWSHL